MTASTDWSDYEYKVRSSTLVTPVIRELWLTPTHHAITYEAGQYVLLNDVEWQVPQRSYSIANEPRSDGAVSILVTLVRGGPTSTWAHQLTVGDKVLLEGPFGTFTVSQEDPGPVLLLGAGSGLAPLRALAAKLTQSESKRAVTLFFSCRTSADLIDNARFVALANDCRRFRYLYTNTRDESARWHSRVPAIIANVIGNDLNGWEVFVSGPPGFVTSCAARAKELGVSAFRIHTEEFFTDPQPWLGALPPVPLR